MASAAAPRTADAAERLAAEEVQLEALDLVADRGKALDVGEHHPGNIVVEDLLRLLVELRPRRLIGDDVGLLDEVAELLVAPMRDVVAAGDRIAGAPDHELARIGIVPGA